MSKFHRTIFQYSHWVRTRRTWKQTHKNNNAWYHDTHGTTSWVYLSRAKLSCVFFWGFLHHRWSLFSRGAIPSTQRLGHRNFHLHTWRKNSQQLASSVRIFWLAHWRSAPRNRPRKKHDILVCIAVFAFGVQKMASLAVLIMKHKPEIHSKKIRRYDWNNKILFFTYQMATTSVLGMVGCQD